MKKIGSIIFFSVIGQVNRKWMIVLCLILIISCLYSFAMINITYFLFVNRILTGIFQVNFCITQSFMTIYFPVWCDQYGPNGKKAMMIASLQIGVPLGVVFGYILTVIIKNFHSVSKH